MAKCDEKLVLTTKIKHPCVDVTFTLTDAVVQAAHLLDLDATILAAILQTNLQSVSTLLSGNRTLLPARQDEWNRATDFVRLYCLLETMTTKNDSGRRWLRQQHPFLEERPIETLVQSDGLYRVLDCIRRLGRPAFGMENAIGRPYHAASANE